MRYSFYLLLKYLPILPDTYTKLYDEFCENLALNGINRDPDDIRRKIVSYANRHLISMKILFWKQFGEMSGSKWKRLNDFQKSGHLHLLPTLLD